MKRSLTFTLLAIVVYAAIVYSVNLARVGTGGVIPGLSSSAGQNGSLAIARLWYRMKLPFETWQQVPELLPVDAQATFVSVEPASNQYDMKAATSLLKWVSKGHVAVWAVRSNDDHVLQKLQLNIAPVKGHTTVSALTSRTSGTAPESTQRSVRWTRLQFPATVSLRGSGLSRAKGQYVSDDGRVIGALIAVGKGQLLVWTAPQVFENGYVDKADNFRLVWSLIGGKAIIWDEYGHGVIAQNMLSAMFLHGREASLWFFVVALCLYLWGAAIRFGVPESHPAETPRLGTEFMDALAWHLRRSRLYNYTVELFCESVRRRLMTRLGIAALVSPGLDATHWAQLDQAVARHPNEELKSAYESWRREADSALQANARRRGQLLEKSRSVIRLLEERNLADNSHEKTK